MNYKHFTQEQLDAISEHAIAIKDIIKEAQPEDPINGYYFHYDEYNMVLQMEMDCYREVIDEVACGARISPLYGIAEQKARLGLYPILEKRLRSLFLLLIHIELFVLLFAYLIIHPNPKNERTVPLTSLRTPQSTFAPVV